MIVEAQSGILAKEDRLLTLGESEVRGVSSSLERGLATLARDSECYRRVNIDERKRAQWGSALEFIFR